MIKKLALSAVGILFLSTPLLASADQLSDLQAQVNALLAQIAALQGGIPPVPPPLCVNLSSNLTLGSTGTDVSDLQNYLSQKGYFSRSATGYYGFITAQAVGKLQIDLGIVSSADDTAYGIVGPKTRAAIACTTPTNSSITVTAPNGGEQWEEGVLNTVTWTPYQYNPDINPSKDVTAYLEKKCDSSVACGGSYYYTLGKVEESGKASIHWISGELNSATQGGVYAPSDDGYYIRVVNNVTGAWDRSDAPFTLVAKPVDLKINGSDGPLTATAGVPLKATWTSTGMSYCRLDNAYDMPNPTVYPIPGFDHLQTSGFATIYVPSQQNWYVSIACTRPDNSTIYDSVLVNQSSAVASLNVTSPNGGEQIDPNQPMAIRFAPQGLSSVAVALYKNDQWKYWINKSFTPTGKDVDLVSWTPSSVFSGFGTADNAGSIFKIYVTGQKADGSGYIDDKSDAPFGFTALGGNSATVDQNGSTVYPPSFTLSGSAKLGVSFVQVFIAPTTFSQTASQPTLMEAASAGYRGVVTNISAVQGGRWQALFEGLTGDRALQNGLNNLYVFNRSDCSLNVSSCDAAILATGSLTVGNTTIPSATIDSNSLTWQTGGTIANPTITGTAPNNGYYIAYTDSAGRGYASDTFYAVNGKWSVTLRSLPIGTYKLTLVGPGYTSVARAILNITGTSPNDWPSLSFSPFIKAGDQNDTWAEGLDIDGLVVEIKNTSSLQQQITFPTNCWYTYKIYDRNTGAMVFNLGSIQQCVAPGSVPSTTWTLAPGEAKGIDFKHENRNFHIPPGNYVMKVDINSKTVVKEAVQFLFNVTPVDGSPTCSIVSDKSSYALGDTARFTWTSKNVTYATFLPDTSGKDNLQVTTDKLPASGYQDIKVTVSGNPFVTLGCMD